MNEAVLLSARAQCHPRREASGAYSRCAWGGPGIGAPCAVCDLPVPRDGMQFEIQFAIHENAPHVDVFHVHTGCYAAWDLERTRPVS